jgi:hypothetical protein
LLVVSFGGGKKREWRGGRAARLERRPLQGQSGGVLGHEGNFAVFFASGFHGDLDVLAEAVREFRRGSTEKEAVNLARLVVSSVAILIVRYFLFLDGLVDLPGDEFLDRLCLRLFKDGVGV